MIRAVAKIRVAGDAVAPRPESVRLTGKERRQLRAIERGLTGPEATRTRRRLALLCLDATAVALLAAGIFVVGGLPWLFAGCVAANLAACLHLDRRPGAPNRRR
ncbi:MAG: hypothetical protein QOI78_8487 [Actinomycetota bacterium]|nr:hypothetical protein [Actinomycetota bacterium]